MTYAKYLQMAHHFFQKLRKKVVLTSSLTKTLINDIHFQSANKQRHLGLVLDSKLDFNEHVNNKINKSNKSINLNLIKKSLTIFKTFVRPNPDYTDIWKILSLSPLKIN